MPDPELEQLELLARIDELVDRLAQWTEPETHWRPMDRCRALVRRLLTRVESLRVRLEAPLVVATFGGTGTGKSTLVNAIVGRECTKTGRQRPTTTRPVLITHVESQPESFGLPLDDFDVVKVDAAILRDIVLIDCPDPDTTEIGRGSGVESETESGRRKAEGGGPLATHHSSNLERLHRLLPFCDVLIYTSTQQKYRSARVTDELGQAATGCRLLFVQTHAEVDEDIRDDWRQRLAAHYEVPEMFFVDSRRALEDQQDGRRPGGDFGRLLDVLSSQLAASQRVLVRRANLVDLVHAALEHCRNQLAGHSPAIEQLEAALDEQRQKLTGQMTQTLQRELLTSRNLWERRLLASVAQKWGFSPFSSVLRLYNGLGGLIASTTLFRARTVAQMTLIGAVQGARWLRSKTRDRRSDERLDELGTLGIDENAVRESQFVLAGYVSSARLDPTLIDAGQSADLREQAARVEADFVNNAAQKVDAIIEDVATRNSGWFTRMRYEILFVAFVAFILFRVGKNFFWDSFLRQFFVEGAGKPESLFGTDFWVSSAVFFALWSLVLVFAFTAKLRRGLTRRIHELADELTHMRTSRGLFPQLEEACRTIDRQRTRLEALSESVAELRTGMAPAGQLGSQREPLSSASPARR
jgi:Dynamin family